MQDLQDSQDLQNKKNEELKEKLQESNINHKVSFDEYSEDNPIKQRKKNSIKHTELVKINLKKAFFRTCRDLLNNMTINYVR